MKKPKALKFGDTIGVIAPSSPCSEKNVEESIKALEELGFKVKLGESCRHKRGYLAGPDVVRANDINKMFKDPEVDGIICIRGGYGATRILRDLDLKSIKHNPKVFVGYSDITALHSAFNSICKMVTFHGPMVSSNFIGENDVYSVENLLKNIMDTEPIGDIINPEKEEMEFLVKGKAKGKIVGGNVSLLVASIGTEFEFDVKGKILFLEDIDETPLRLDRMIVQLRDSGKLKDCEGIILGDFANCDDLSENSLTLEQVFIDLLSDLCKPVITNLKSGHCHPMVTIPFGVDAIIDSEKKTFKIIENAVV